MKKAVLAFAVTIMFYLLQVCLMQHLKIFGVTGNLLAVNLAILTVSFGKKYTFVFSCITGILVEAMTSSVGGLLVILYPAFGMLFAQLFSDMSDEKRERLALRQAGLSKKKNGDLNPYYRIPLNAVCIAGAIEAICLVYVNVSGTDISANLYIRAVFSIIYTGILAVLLMWPVRKICGVQPARTFIKSR